MVCCTTSVFLNFLLRIVAAKNIPMQQVWMLLNRNMAGVAASKSYRIVTIQISAFIQENQITCWVFLLHDEQACFEGNFKVVELLLDEGANKGVKNRWGQTPLREAILNRCWFKLDISILCGWQRVTQAGSYRGAFDTVESTTGLRTSFGRALRSSCQVLLFFMSFKCCLVYGRPNKVSIGRNSAQVIFDHRRKTQRQARFGSQLLAYIIFKKSILSKRT